MKKYKEIKLNKTKREKEIFRKICLRMSKQYSLVYLPRYPKGMSNRKYKKLLSIYKNMAKRNKNVRKDILTKGFLVISELKTEIEKYRKTHKKRWWKYYKQFKF